MLSDVTRQMFVREAARLAPVLYDCLDHSSTAVHTLPYSELRFPHAFAFHRRALFREALESVGGLPGGWLVSGNTRQAGQTILRQPDLGSSLRVLSESSVTTNGVPHAGSNAARRAEWGSVMLFPTPIVEDRDLLLLMNPKVTEPTLRIVHTTDPGRFKGTVPCDFAVAMLRSVDDFGDASFDTAEDFVDFFATLEDEESGDA
jgi:hypothetical protein